MQPDAAPHPPLHLAGMYLTKRFVATVKEWWAVREGERERGGGERLVLSLPLSLDTSSLTCPKVCYLGD